MTVTNERLVSRHFPNTAAELKQDSLSLQFVPGKLVVTITGQTVLVTSYPFYEGEGEDEAAYIMVRHTPTDPSTNVKIRYFQLMRMVGEQDL